MTEPIILGEIATTNFDLLRLLNGGTMDSKGSLFSIRLVKTWESKTKAGRPMHGLTVQIISNGINSTVERQDVIIKKVKEKVIVEKIVVKKPVQEELKFEENDNEEVLF